jgi:excisionase family DNA binding protein
VSEPLTLTVEEAAELLGISRGSAYQAVRAGDIPSIRIGRRVLIPRARLMCELLGEQSGAGRKDEDLQA